MFLILHQTNFGCFLLSFVEKRGSTIGFSTPAILPIFSSLSCYPAHRSSKTQSHPNFSRVSSLNIQGNRCYTQLQSTKILSLSIINTGRFVNEKQRLSSQSRMQDFFSNNVTSNRCDSIPLFSEENNRINIQRITTQLKMLTDTNC